MQQSSTYLYSDGATWLHRVHPYNKLAFIIFAGSMAYCAPGSWITRILFLGLMLCASATCGLASGILKAGGKILFPLAAYMLPIHGMLYPENQTLIARFHSIDFYQEGILFACNILLQLAILLTSSLFFVFTTRPADLIKALVQTGWPPRIAYLFGGPLLMLPAMRYKIQTIQAAQRSRGLDSEASLYKRIRSIGPLIAPLILGSFCEIEQRAIALELRGFNLSGNGVLLRPVPDSSRQKVARWLLLFSFLFLCGYRLLIERIQ